MHFDIVFILAVAILIRQYAAVSGAIVSNISSSRARQLYVLTEKTEL